MSSRERGGELEAGVEGKLRKNAASSVIMVRELWSDTVDVVADKPWVGLKLYRNIDNCS